MASIETDNPLIAKELQRLEDLISDGGGGLHSNVVLSSEGPSLGVKTTEPMPRGKEIIRLSREILLPADKYNLGVKNNEFTLDFPKNSNFTTLQRKLADSMVTLYNLTNKVPYHKEHSFLYVFAKYPEVLERILAKRALGNEMTAWHTKILHGLSEEEESDYLSDSFLKTRNLGYNDYIRTSSVPVLMPVVDFMNHHWNGATFTVGLGVRKGDLAIATAQLEGSLECFAFYNVMDPLDSLIRYDFIDESAPVIRSIPLDIEVRDVGIIRVDSAPAGGGNRRRPAGMADLHRFLPNFSYDEKEKVLKVSHLLVPVEGSPLALRRVLHMLLVQLAQKNLDAAFFGPRVREAEQFVLEKNIEYYQQELKYLDGVIKEKGPAAPLERLRKTYELQISKLQRYKPMGQASTDVGFSTPENNLDLVDERPPE